LNDLHYEQGRWFFTDPAIAHTFAQCPLYMTEHVWTSPKSLVINTLFSDLLRNALDAQVISRHDMLFGTDAAVWHNINTTNQPAIKRSLKQVFSQKETFYLSNEEDYDLFLKGKFRGINPWIKQGEAFYRLTELDPMFKAKYERVQELMKRGWYIKYQ